MIDLNTIPDALKEGENWPLLDLDPDWVWVSYDKEGNVVGILIAANCHGLVLIWRVKMLPSAPFLALGLLFRRFLRAIRLRGALGYFTFLDMCGRPEEQALARIAFRAGGVLTAATTVVFGSVNAKHIGEK